MKIVAELSYALLLLAMLAVIYQLLGRGVFILVGSLSALWFTIALILLSRPPAIPEFNSQHPGSDEQYVVRKDVVPKLPLRERVRWSFAVACGSCLLLWLTLGLLRA